MHPLIFLLKILPQNLISWFVGWLVRLEFADKFQNFLNRQFVQLFKIDMSEAEKPLFDYKSIEDVFTRRLKPGSREIKTPFCSPCDGTLTISTDLEADTAIQAKGLHYDASELVFARERSPGLSDLKAFTTIYLAPHNYHRVHSPVSGEIRHIRYIPGELWPVNDLSVSQVPRVFTRNERLVFDIEAEGGGICHLAMVGAFNVGRISTPLISDWTSNARPFGPRQYRHFEKSEPFRVKIGDELGTFMLGSTVVMVMNEDFLKSYSVKKTTDAYKVKLGELLTP